MSNNDKTTYFYLSSMGEDKQLRVSGYTTPQNAEQLIKAVRPLAKDLKVKEWVEVPEE